MPVRQICHGRSLAFLTVHRGVSMTNCFVGLTYRLALHVSVAAYSEYLDLFRGNRSKFHVLV